MKEGKNIPEIRFKGFEGKWEERNIGQIAKVSTGYPFESNLFNDKGKLLVITNGNIQNNSAFVDKSVGNRIDINNDIILNEYILKKNDILVTMDGTVGRTAKVKEQNQILAQRVGRLTSNTEAEFLYQFLNTGKFFQKMMSISHGGTIKHISLLEISNYKDLVPTNKKEQSQIGTFFQNLDKQITLEQQKHDKLVTLKKAMLEKMFPKEGASVPEIRFEGFEGEWIQKEIKELFKITRGEVLAATETSQVKTGFMTYPVYSSQTKNNGLMGYYHDYLFENAITWTTDGANAGTVKYRKGKFYSTNVNGVLLSDDGYANQAIAESINIIAWKHVSYVGNPKLMNNVMSKIKIYISDSLEEQQLISDYFNTFDTFISLQKQKIDKLKNIKKACLDKMFV